MKILPTNFNNLNTSFTICQGELLNTTYPIRIKQITKPPKTPNEFQIRDTFQTPNYAVDLLIPFIPKDILRVWECSAGGGKIANVLLKNHFYVSQTDIRLVGYISKVHNFISDGYPEPIQQWIEYKNKFCIITNPPFSIKEQFIEKAFEYKVPFAFLINMDYSLQMCNWIRRGCQRIIPDRRIDFITPFGRNGKTSSSQFHSGWLTYNFNLPSNEVIVELSKEEKRNNI